MALSAICERNLPRHGSRCDVGWHVSERHGQRVAPAVFGFRVPLAHEIARDMALVTGGYVRVLPPAPIIKDFTHHVAILAGVRISTQVGRALCVVKGIERGPKRNRDQADHHHQID